MTRFMQNNLTAGLKKRGQIIQKYILRKSEKKRPDLLRYTNARFHTYHYMLFHFKKNLCKLCVLFLTLYILRIHISFKKILCTPTYIECFIKDEASLYNYKLVHFLSMTAKRILWKVKKYEIYDKEIGRMN